MHFSVYVHVGLMEKEGIQIIEGKAKKAVKNSKPVRYEPFFFDIPKLIKKYKVSLGHLGDKVTAFIDPELHLVIEDSVEEAVCIAIMNNDIVKN